ncbi:FPR1 [Symbiodinium natans]|uniref:peptidylprolyl isomerase n=1 Tax=Symbiodinium natans TaxID=878477 RepID=A0A812J5B8_9DINO|nr:FPR1 [Symbiodinium natans]
MQGSTKRAMRGRRQLLRLAAVFVLGLSCWLFSSISVAVLCFIPMQSHAPRVLRRAVPDLGEKRGPKIDSRFPPPEDVLKYRGPNPKVRRNRRASGIATEQLSPPKKGGLIPSRGSRVYIRHTGWTVQDAQMFDSSFLRTQEPEMFEVSEVLAAWRAALLEMREGEKMRVWVPASRPTQLDWGVYSERGQYPWVFDIELVKVEEDPPYWLLGLLVTPIIAGELYIRITGRTPGEALNEIMYGDLGTMG